MAEFKSDPVSIARSGKEIYIFLGNFNNFERLMPEQVINWRSGEDSCSFTIKGMTDLALRMGERREYDQVRYDSDGDSPFPFHLLFDIADTGNGCTVSATLGADLNPMLKMMASRPLQNFVNLLVEKLRDVTEAG